jgi:hypothetical protein
MRSWERLTNVDGRKIRSLARKYFTVKAIAERLDCNYSTVHGYMVAHGIPRNGRKGRKFFPRKARPSIHAIRKLARAGHIDAEIGERFGFSISTINSMRKTNNIPSGQSVRTDKKMRMAVRLQTRGLSLLQTANRMGCTKQHIAWLLWRWNVRSDI